MLTAPQKIRRDILLWATECKTEDDTGFDVSEADVKVAAGEGGVAIDSMYEAVCGLDIILEIEREFRSSYDEETGLKCEYSRHYEAKLVAKKLQDGTWVGWTYWYGGGKYGEAYAIEWIADAYNLTVTKVPKVIKVFRKV